MVIIPNKLTSGRLDVKEFRNHHSGHSLLPKSREEGRVDLSGEKQLADGEEICLKNLEVVLVNQY